MIGCGGANISSGVRYATRLQRTAANAFHSNQQFTNYFHHHHHTHKQIYKTPPSKLKNKKINKTGKCTIQNAVVCFLLMY